eukprot:9665511-Prorocentrum_lima.AAC.1
MDKGGENTSSDAASNRAACKLPLTGGSLALSQPLAKAASEEWLRWAATGARFSARRWRHAIPL